MAINSQQKKEYLVKELEGLLSRFGIHVRYEHLSDAKSGLCTFKGTTYLIIDTSVVLEDRLEFLKTTLAGYDLSTVYLPPAVREFLSEK